MKRWEEEFWWYVEFWERECCLPGKKQIAEWRGVKRCGWSEVLFSRGLVAENSVGGLKFTESSWRMIERRRREFHKAHR